MQAFLQEPKDHHRASSEKLLSVQMREHASLCIFCRIWVKMHNIYPNSRFQELSRVGPPWFLNGRLPLGNIRDLHIELENNFAWNCKEVLPVRVGSTGQVEQWSDSIEGRGIPAGVALIPLYFPPFGHCSLPAPHCSHCKFKIRILRIYKPD